MANTINKIQTESRYGGLKSRKGLRLVYRKTPGGRTVTHYKDKKPKCQKCASCGTRLAGTVRESPCKMKNMPKTMKRPERPYGGYLCSACMRRKIIAASRTKA